MANSLETKIPFTILTKMYMCNHLNLSITDNILVEFSVVSTIHLLLSYLLSLRYKICIKKKHTFLGGGGGYFIITWQIK